MDTRAEKRSATKVLAGQTRWHGHANSTFHGHPEVTQLFWLSFNVTGRACQVFSIFRTDEKLSDQQLRVIFVLFLFLVLKWQVNLSSPVKVVAYLVS